MIMADDLDMDGSSNWSDVPSSSSRIDLARDVFSAADPEPPVPQLQPHEDEPNPFSSLTKDEPVESPYAEPSADPIVSPEPAHKDLEADLIGSKSPTLPGLSYKPSDNKSHTVASPTRSAKARVSTLRSSRMRKSASKVQVESVASTDPLGPLGGVAQDDDDQDDYTAPPQQTSTEQTTDGVGRLSIKSPPQNQQHHEQESQQHSDADAPPPPPVEHFDITVGDPIKIGDLTSAHTVYTVHTKTSSPLFSKQDASVTRRYRDFRWLYNALTYNNPGIIVPPPPEKQAVGRFNEDFVEARRASLSNMLTKISKHPVLQNDEEFRIFLESETFTTDIKSRQHTQQHPGTGGSESKGFMSSLGGAFSFSGKFVEMEQYFLDKKGYVDTLESQFKYLAKALDLVVAQRKELSDSTQEFAQALQLLSEVELSKGFSELVESFAQTQVKIRDLYFRQCMQDVLSLSTTLEEYIRLIASIRLTFAQRQRSYFTFQTAEQDLARKRAYVDKVQKSGKTMQDKITILNEDIQSQEKRVQDAKTAFDTMGKLMQAEFSRFEVEKAQDFRNAVELFLENAVEAQKEAIEIWETFYQLAGFAKP